MCFHLELGVLLPQNYKQCLTLCCILHNSCRVHVHNVQVCYICILVPWWCTAPINSSFTFNSSLSAV
uniref:Uncharacterized protein n=1 Tax=Macaca fascicularis TaxID=9541 RepID=A0A7N9CDJ1_MACFA